LLADPVFLIVRSGLQPCGLPLAHVIEVFRPLPIEPQGPTPAFLLGLAMVRGRSLRVVDLGLLLGGRPSQPGGRFVGLRMAELQAVLSVDAVLGLRRLQAEALQALPPLVGAASAVAEALASLDPSLLLLLRAAFLMPREAA
jgi:chemotaxis signal transduction protein